MRTALLLALICLSPACDFFDDDSGDGTWITYDEVPAAAKEAYCTYLTRCGLFPDQATCLSAQITTVLNLDANTTAAIAAGKIRYNGSNMRTCLDSIAEATCDRTDQNGRVASPACSSILTGLGMNNDECFIDAECASGFCSGGSTTTACQAGRCIGDAAPPVEPAQIGMPCSTQAGCVAGAYCDTSSTAVCMALKTTGAECVQTYECAYGLGCAGSTGTRTCKVLPGLNESCAIDGLCRDEGLYCDALATTPACKKVGLPPTTCTSSAQCSSFYPCNTTLGQCAKAPTLGQSCSSTGRCFDAGSYCDNSTLICTALKGDGSMCTSDTECTSNNCDLAISPSLCTTPASCI